MKKTKIEIPEKKLAEFCRTHGIKTLALFGSVLRDDFSPESDVDVLVEFKPGTRIGLIRLGHLENELRDIFGRKVDLNTPDFISKYFRPEIMAEREVQYVET
jgi:predicted nucleotidyltransferase